jgi:endoglucanase
MSAYGCCAAVFATVFLAAAARADDAPCATWPEWQAFKRLYLSADGRVVDASTPQSLTVSEGQAYAMNFALIANDPEDFAKALNWTRDNLTGGNLERTLPAWKWGRGEDGKWTVLDRNSAADADLWMAYALTQAGALWHNRDYTRLGAAMSQLILREEIALAPGLGATVLPGPQGFVTQGTWRLSASYVPLQVIRSFQRGSDSHLWSSVLESSYRVIVGSSPRGYAADWIRYTQTSGFSADPITHGVGSYNAIRVYLWAGLLATDDPLAAAVVRQLKPMATAASKQAPPESIDTDTLEFHGQAPVGFLAAVSPLLSHLRETDAVATYRKRIETESLKDNQHYYSDALTLFGLGWLEGRYRFDKHGDLSVRWNGSCHGT